MYSLTFRVRVMLPWQRTRAPIANPPNSELWGIPYHSPKLHPGPCNSVDMRPLTDRHTDAGDHNTFRVVYDSREM